jgi:DNA topoisomerase-2
MKLWNLTEEKKNELLKQRDNKQQELKRLQAKTKEQMWEEDLAALLEKMDEVEAKEREEDEAEVGPNAAGKKGGGCSVGMVFLVSCLSNVSSSVRI